MTSNLDKTTNSNRATSTSYTPQYLVLIFIASSQVVKIMKLVNKVYDMHISTINTSIDICIDFPK